VHAAKRVISIGDAPFVGGTESPGEKRYEAFGVPWLANDANLTLKTLTDDEDRELNTAFRRSGGRWRWRRVRALVTTKCPLSKGCGIAGITCTTGRWRRWKKCSIQTA
jgi:hypothetical protein